MSIALEEVKSNDTDDELGKPISTTEDQNNDATTTNSKANIGIYVCAIIFYLIILSLSVVQFIVIIEFIPTRLAPTYCIQYVANFGLITSMIVVFCICIYVAKYKPYAQPIMAEFKVSMDESQQPSASVEQDDPSSWQSCVACIKTMSELKPTINMNVGFLKNKDMLNDSLLSEYENNEIMTVLEQYVKLLALIMILKELPIFIISILKIVYSDNDDVYTPVKVLSQRIAYFARMMLMVLITPCGGIRKNKYHQKIWGQMCHPDHALFVIPLMRIIQMKSYPIYTNTLSITLVLTGTHLYKSDWDVIYGIFNVIWCGLGILMALTGDLNSYRLLCLCRKKLRNEEIQLLLGMLRKNLQYFGVFQFYDVKEDELDFMREHKDNLKSSSIQIPKMLYVTVCMTAISVILIMIAAIITIAS